uniref:Anion exchange protein n=1 Tax=Caenorhabditis japonica TaxID=281687 RepID=A0A8R1HLQ8_CAEJA
MPVSSSCRRDDVPEVDHNEQESVNELHHLVVDVFTVNEDDGTWRQKSRFARYEEDCEGFDNHFGKPHVPFITMAAYHALQQVTSKSILLPDVEFKDVDDFISILESRVNDVEHPGLGRKVSSLVKSRIASLEKTRSLSKVHSASTQSLNQSGPVKKEVERGGISRSLLSAPNNLSSLGISPGRRLPTSVSGLRFKGSFLRDPDPTSHPMEPVIWDEANEVSMLVTGVVPDVKVCRLIAIRFNETTTMQEVFPNMNNIRHVFFLIGPQLEEMQYLDMGRALASVASNPNFTVAFDKLKSAESITRAIEGFLADTVVIAPGRIDNKNLVAGDLIRKLVNMQAEKHGQNSAQQQVHPASVDIEKNAPKIVDEKEQSSSTWFFSGVLDDFRKRNKFYWSDYMDGFAPLIFTVVVYMFCVTVVPTLTFGAILSIGTDGILAVKECLIGQALCGVIWSFFSCQPLLIMSPTGPFLVFEKALYQFTKARQLDFLEVRLYTGIFLFLISVFGSAFNIAYLIRFVTIYTEDIFCALISMIFFYEVFEFLEIQQHHNKIQDLAYYLNNSANCTDIPLEECHISRPNTFLLQLIMVIASIAVFHYLRQLSRSSFFGRSFRNLCGNFGGCFAVVVVTVFYHVFFKNVEVSMVDIPADLGEYHRHGLIVQPTYLPSGQTLLVAAIAAPLLFVLLFVETEIPQQMALRESRKLKKGGGLHWDLIVAGACTLVCSVMGLPWQCPAAVQSLAHITALTVYKKSAPGEPSRASHVIEQRVSGLVTYLSLGVFSVVGHFLAIPSAAIFGVFFYLGIRNLNGNLLLMRVKMWFLLAKYRGNHKFLDLAPFYVTGLYTFIQCIVLVSMFTAKSTQIGGLCFPLMLVACSFFVNKVLPLIFTKELLEALDGEDVEEGEVDNDNEENPVDFYYNTRIPV